jgi:hypothetical protein
MPLPNSEPLRTYFTGLTEYTFHSRLGVADPTLVDYISDLLLRFVHQNSLYRIRDTRGRALTQVVEMLNEAALRVGPARREIHRHIGDYTLFWAGMYPEALDERQGPRKLDHLVDYCEQGKRAYWIASTIDIDSEDVVPSVVLERLSCQFELCTYGLREIRAEWERRDDELPGKPFLIN